MSFRGIHTIFIAVATQKAYAAFPSCKLFSAIEKFIGLKALCKIKRDKTDYFAKQVKCPFYELPWDIHGLPCTSPIIALITLNPV